MSNRSGETEFLSIFRDIKLPAQPRNRVPFAQQKSVSEFAVCVRRISAVHEAQNPSSPAVRNFKQHGAVSLVHILWFVEIEVRRKLDLPLRVARSFVQVYDLPVMNVFRLDGKVHAPNDPFVAARQSERPTALNILTRKDLHTRDVRRGGRCHESE